MSSDDKAERLAAALRENLRRRKAQARALGEQGAPGESSRGSLPNPAEQPANLAGDD